MHDSYVYFLRTTLRNLCARAGLRKLRRFWLILGYGLVKPAQVVRKLAQTGLAQTGLAQIWANYAHSLA